MGKSQRFENDFLLFLILRAFMQTLFYFYGSINLRIHIYVTGLHPVNCLCDFKETLHWLRYRYDKNGCFVCFKLII